jgi:hypothetical protein
MIKHILGAALAMALIGAPVAPGFAQAATDQPAATTKKKAKAPKKIDPAAAPSTTPGGAPAATAKPAKELTPQQQKMKDCSAKWGDYKKEKNVKGKTEHNKFMSGCLKG